MQYESPISSGKKVMNKVKVFVHATAADADTDARAMTLSPRTFVPSLLKNNTILFKRTRMSFAVALIVSMTTKKFEYQTTDDGHTQTLMNRSTKRSGIKKYCFSLFVMAGICAALSKTTTVGLVYSLAIVQ